MTVDPQYIILDAPLHPSGRELTVKEIEEFFPAIRKALADAAEKMTGARPDTSELEILIGSADEN